MSLFEKKKKKKAEDEEWRLCECVYFIYRRLMRQQEVCVLIKDNTRGRKENTCKLFFKKKRKEKKETLLIGIMRIKMELCIIVSYRDNIECEIQILWGKEKLFIIVESDFLCALSFLNFQFARSTFLLFIWVSGSVVKSNGCRTVRWDIEGLDFDFFFYQKLVYTSIST